MFSEPLVILGGISLSARNQTTWTAVDSPRSQSQGGRRRWQTHPQPGCMTHPGKMLQGAWCGSALRFRRVFLFFFFFLHAHRHHMSHPGLEQTCIIRCKKITHERRCIYWTRSASQKGTDRNNLITFTLKHKHWFMFSSREISRSCRRIKSAAGLAAGIHTRAHTHSWTRLACLEEPSENCGFPTSWCSFYENGFERILSENGADLLLWLAWFQSPR